MWTQIDYALVSNTRRSYGLTPPRVYVEAQHERAMSYVTAKGWHPAVWTSWESLEELYEWLHRHEARIHTAESIDVWIADELAAGCVFVPEDEVARVLKKE